MHQFMPTHRPGKSFSPHRIITLAIFQNSSGQGQNGLAQVAAVVILNQLLYKYRRQNCNHSNEQQRSASKLPFKNQIAGDQNEHSAPCYSNTCILREIIL